MEPPQITEISQTADGRLGLAWTTLVEGTQGILISVATNIDFDASCLFLLPVVYGCQLDVGPGAWYIRVGALVGDTERGTVLWSLTSGPVPLQPPKGKQQIVAPPAKLTLHHTQPIVNGHRFHTGLLGVPYGCLFDSRIRGEHGRRWSYAFDAGNGWVDCLGFEVGKVYDVRVFGLVGIPGLPWKDLVPVEQGRLVSGKKAAIPLQHGDSTSKSNSNADRALLHQAHINTRQRFTSHGDYLRFVAALRRTEDEKQSV